MHLTGAVGWNPSLFLRGSPALGVMPLRTALLWNP